MHPFTHPPGSRTATFLPLQQGQLSLSFSSLHWQGPAIRLSKNPSSDTHMICPREDRWSHWLPAGSLGTSQILQALQKSEFHRKKSNNEKKKILGCIENLSPPLTKKTHTTINGDQNFQGQSMSIPRGHYLYSISSSLWTAMRNKETFGLIQFKLHSLFLIFACSQAVHPKELMPNCWNSTTRCIYA